MAQKNIVIIGAGYVGLSNAVLLAQHNTVTLVDVDPSRVADINAGRCPIAESDIARYMHDNPQKLLAVAADDPDRFSTADVVIISTPTDYDSHTNLLDTSTISDIIATVFNHNTQATVVIKSTVPVGFTDNQIKKHGTDRILFSPEFLREGKALHDCLYPSRIVVGHTGARGKQFAQLVSQGASIQNAPTLFTNPSEAEAIKLFSNTYLAMRVAFFNELDSYALASGMESRDIITGVSLDPRIGKSYNNPSFGYGGYCLPKDTKQLLANYAAIPQKLMGAVVDANHTRKNFIAQQIIDKKPTCVGVYRLSMKTESYNFRESSVQDIMHLIRAAGIAMIVYEPLVTDTDFSDTEVVANLATFKARADLIIANRSSSDLDDVLDKIFSRDLFGLD